MVPPNPLLWHSGKCFLVVLVYYKGNDSGTAKWKRRTGHGTEWSEVIVCPLRGVLSSQDLDVFLHLETVWNLSLGGSMEVSLYRHG